MGLNGRLNQNDRMRLHATLIICATILSVSILASVCFEKLMDSNRELVIRHVIDLTPMIKKK